MIRRATIWIIIIGRIPVNVADEKLEEKLIEFFSFLGIEVEGADIEDCHRLGYRNPKNAIVRYVNCKFCYQACDKKWNLHKLDSKRLGLNPIKTLYFSENLTPLNQLLAWKCRELKRTYSSQYMECLGCH